MYCCGCEHHYKRSVKVKLDNGLVAKTCPQCDSEDVFTDRDMAAFERRREKERKRELQQALNDTRIRL